MHACVLGWLEILFDLLGIWCCGAEKGWGWFFFGFFFRLGRTARETTKADMGGRVERRIGPPEISIVLLKKNRCRRLIPGLQYRLERYVERERWTEYRSEWFTDLLRRVLFLFLDLAICCANSQEESNWLNQNNFDRKVLFSKGTGQNFTARTGFHSSRFSRFIWLKKEDDIKTTINILDSLLFNLLAAPLLYFPSQQSMDLNCKNGMLHRLLSIYYWRK